MLPVLRLAVQRGMLPVRNIRFSHRHCLSASATMELSTIRRVTTTAKDIGHVSLNSFMRYKPPACRLVPSMTASNALRLSGFKSQDLQCRATGSVDAMLQESAANAAGSTSVSVQLADGSGTAGSQGSASLVDKDVTGSGGSISGPEQSLLLMAGAFDMPHPDKAHKGGEDAHYIAENQRSIGVADGVGGWAEAGIDAGIYARLLMSEAKKAADSSSGLSADPKQILKTAHVQTQVQGSSTACIVCLNKATLHAANLGDSGFLVVRDGKLAFQSPQQQHSFNFPFQISSDATTGDQPDAALMFEVGVQPGDILIAATDGLLDNVFPEEITVIATLCKKRGGTASETARVLCEYARMRAADPQYISPFAYGAFQAGHIYQGGKMDDITAVVAYVVPASKL